MNLRELAEYSHKRVNVFVAPVHRNNKSLSIFRLIGDHIVCGDLREQCITVIIDLHF